MHIAEIISGKRVNGAVMHCLEISRQLARRGHRITVVCRPGCWIIEQLRDEPVDIIESTLKRTPKELRRVAKLLREQRVDVVHTHMSSAHFFGILLRFIAGFRCVATAHNRKFQLHWMLNHRVIAASHATAHYQRRFNFVSPRRLATVHNFIDIDKYDSTPAEARQNLRAEFGLADHHVLIGCVGSVIERKGMRYLVAALPKILESCPDLRLLVVGDGENDYARQLRSELAPSLGVSDKIIWAGHRSDIAAVLASLDIYALPSLEETFPLSTLEAMASRLPVVATSVGGLPECIVEGNTGFLVPPADSDAFAAVVSRLATYASLRNAMGEAGFARVTEYFSPDSQLPKIEAVFEQAIGSYAAA